MSRDVKFHPTDPNVAVSFVAGHRTATGALYTTDAGTTWRIATGIGFPTIRLNMEFAFHTGWTGGGNGCVYVQVEQRNGLALYRSTNGGARYARVAINYMSASQVWYNNSLWIAPLPRDANPANDVLIAGTVTMARSANGGATWNTGVNQGGAHVDFHLLRTAPGYNGTTDRRVMVCGDGGFYRIRDALATPFAFDNLNKGLHIHQHYAGARDAAGGQLLTGAQDNGIWSKKGAQPFQTVMFGDGGYSAIDPTNPAFEYGSTQFGNVLRRANGKLEWISGVARRFPPTKEKKPGYIITDAKNRQSQFIAPVVLDPNNPQRLLVGMVQLWRTDDARTPNDEAALTGPAWRVIKPALTNRNPISAIAVQPGNANVMWIGHSFAPGIFRTTNATAATPAWTEIGRGLLPVRHCSRIMIDPKNTNRIFVVYGGFTANNVWRSLDGGRTFTPWSSFPAVPVRDLKVHPTNAKWLYAATEIGLLVSEDSGASWTAAASPADVSIFELAWGGTELWCFTHGRGVFHQKTVEEGPDLELVGITANTPGTTWNGDARYPVTMTVRNNGSVAAPRSVYALVMSSDNRATTQDYLLDTGAVPPINPGQRVTVNASFGTPTC